VRRHERRGIQSLRQGESQRGKIGMTVQQQIEAVPSWANWLVVVGSAALSWIQPVAGIVAILWGCLQIYLAVEKRWFKKKG
jgi:hypothetical protein